MTYEVDYDINNPPKSINTKFGKATISQSGHYVISSRKEGNHQKTLHRLIFEDFYNINLEKEFPNQKIIVHHIDGNKLNNDISNLDIMEWGEHTALHKTGTAGKTHTECAKQKMSKMKNTTGFYRVIKEKSKSFTQGFRWAYQYYVAPNNRKTIASVDLNKLMKKVIDNGAIWKIIDENNARQTCEQYGYDFDKLNIEVN